MQYEIKPHLVILDGNDAIRALLPLLSLGKGTARLNPKLSTSPVARKINPVGQIKTDNSKRLAKISNHAYKNLEKNQIIFIDNQVHKSTIHRFSANTPQKSITLNKSPRTSRRTLY